MALPAPQPGLVISYSFLWSHEHRSGLEEGRKDRPCVIVLAVTRDAGGATVVRVAPITHSPPVDPVFAIEIPLPVKRHLGLDAERSWVVLDEFNEFTWPGFDIRPLPHQPGRIDYGFLPPRLFSDVVTKARLIWRSGREGRRPGADPPFWPRRGPLFLRYFRKAGTGHLQRRQEAGRARKLPWRYADRAVGARHRAFLVDNATMTFHLMNGRSTGKRPPDRSCAQPRSWRTLQIKQSVLDA